ncbi:leucine-rich repeat domain-containing protein [bacterium]|nr:leucine-rich repeat domain-containing protein [bacterium]
MYFKKHYVALLLYSLTLCLFITRTSQAGLIELTPGDLCINHDLELYYDSGDEFDYDKDGNVIREATPPPNAIFAPPIRVAKEKILAPFLNIKGIIVTVPEDIMMHPYGGGKQGAAVENVFIELAFANKAAITNFRHKLYEPFVKGYRDQEVDPKAHMVEFAYRINFSGCKISRLPIFVEELKHLNELDLSNNLFQQIPSKLKNMSHVKKIDFRGNRINKNFIPLWAKDDRFIFDWTPQEGTEPWH